MRDDVPDTATDIEEEERLRELIRVKIDIEGLNEEDIDFLRNQSSRIISERHGNRI
jgi:hypothetical protein